jgi:hypothetical protein
MSLTARELNRLHRIISIAQKLIREAPTPKRGRPLGSRTRKTKRIRRAGKELVRFREVLSAERKKGVPVAELARKYDISSSYIYLL